MENENKSKPERNYRALFVIGVSLLAAGIAIDSSGSGMGLIGVGVVFIIISWIKRRR